MYLNTILKNIINSNVYQVINKTPLNFANQISNQINNNVWLKREDISPIFSFKLRGAYSKISKLTKQEKLNGIVACSAGNHAQGVAYSSKLLGINAVIVMPTITPTIKIDAVKNLGGNIIIYGDTYDEASNYANHIMKTENRTLIHPYNDIDVISGQGTIALELIEQIKNKNIDHIFCCVGGGGLISGIGAFMKLIKPEIKIIGVEAENCCAMTKSLEYDKLIKLNNICTYAEGAAVKQVGKINFDIAKQVIDNMILVNNKEINNAIIDSFMDTRTVLEPAGALALAGLKKYLKENKLENTNNVAILSGSNIDFKKLRHISEKIENDEVILCVTIPEKNGSFKKLYELIYPRNVTEFSYRMNNSNNANIYMSFHSTKKNNIINKIKNSYNVINLENNILAKNHIRYFVGGKNVIINERLFRFNFPEKPKALHQFFKFLDKDINISLFHYRNFGADIGKVLVGLQCNDNYKLEKFLHKLNYEYYEETDNELYKIFL